MPFVNQKTEILAKIWNENQKHLLNIRIKEKLEKSERQKDYSKKLLQTCKTWGGPCTTAEELHITLTDKSDIQERIVKVELAYYRTTHKNDLKTHPELCRLNKITHEERMENLLILLSGDNAASGSVADLPTNADALAVLQGTEVVSNIRTSLNINDICVVVWCMDEQWNWFVGYIKDKLNDEQYIADHLERLQPGNNTRWRYPMTEDMQTIFHEQIVPIEINGDWKITNNSRHMTFQLKNSAEIDNKFEEFIKEIS